jgi:hypothetical protein
LKLIKTANREIDRNIAPNALSARRSATDHLGIENILSHHHFDHCEDMFQTPFSLEKIPRAIRLFARIFL